MPSSSTPMIIEVWFSFKNRVTFPFFSVYFKAFNRMLLSARSRYSLSPKTNFGEVLVFTLNVICFCLNKGSKEVAIFFNKSVKFIVCKLMLKLVSCILAKSITSSTNFFILSAWLLSWATMDCI